MTEVLLFHLLNKEQVAGRYMQEDDHTITMEYPMQVELRKVDGAEILQMQKYLPFNIDQVLILQKKHIIARTSVTTEFAKYYYNNIHYHSIYTQPNTENTLAAINKSLDVVLSKENQDFADKMRELSSRIPDTLSSNVH